MYMKSAMDPVAITPLLVDALVKITRLVANVCINREAGILIAAADGIDVLSTLLMVVIEADEQELLLNVVSAITNLSFYGRIEESAEKRRGSSGAIDVDEDTAGVSSGAAAPQTIYRSRIFARREEICSCLVGVLLHENQLAVVEAARAFGNFSRDDAVRGVIVGARGDEAMALLLDSANNDDVTFAVVGCMVNLAASPKHNRILTGKYGCKEYDCVGKLVRGLRRYGLKSVALSAVTCKVLYNLSFGCGGAGERFADCFFNSPTRDDLVLLRDTLEELLDIANEAKVEADAQESKFEVPPYQDFIDTGSALFTVIENTLRLTMYPGGDDGRDEAKGGESKYEELDESFDDTCSNRK